MCRKYDDVSFDDVDFAHLQLLQCKKRIATVKRDLYIGEDISNPHNISPEDLSESGATLAPNITISDCQICVELAAKAIFKTVGVNPVERHEISFNHERVTGLLNRLPSDSDLSKRVPRVIFLTQFWERFYTLSKYGVPERNISSFELLNESDALRAVQDADYCIDTAEELIDLVISEKEIDRADLSFPGLI